MEETLRLNAIEVRMDIARDYIINVLKNDTFPQMDRTLCLIMDIDYDEVMAEKEAKYGKV